jgi:hypothetical protein
VHFPPHVAGAVSQREHWPAGFLCVATLYQVCMSGDSVLGAVTSPRPGEPVNRG